MCSSVVYVVKRDSKMRIVLTSFRDAHNWKGTSCSIARWQPSWSSIPEFPVNVKPIYNGKTIGDWLDPLVFKNKYNSILWLQSDRLIKFFEQIENDETLVLCCWCNLEQERQRKWNNKLFCHRILLGWWIEEHFQFAIVKYADGAEKPIWRRE